MGRLMLHCWARAQNTTARPACMHRHLLVSTCTSPRSTRRSCRHRRHPICCPCRREPTRLPCMSWAMPVSASSSSSSSNSSSSSKQCTIAIRPTILMKTISFPWDRSRLATAGQASPNPSAVFRTTIWTGPVAARQALQTPCRSVAATHPDCCESRAQSSVSARFCDGQASRASRISKTSGSLQRCFPRSRTPMTSLSIHTLAHGSATSCGKAASTSHAGRSASTRICLARPSSSSTTGR
ncbi:hypothetical protein BC831DRAFT_260049 [Entophlyctis helioformis]|nr:hypothetical protein BC831DRAFT_260049 [Entophlyctis helioformis]